MRTSALQNSLHREVESSSNHADYPLLSQSEAGFLVDVRVGRIIIQPVLLALRKQPTELKFLTPVISNGVHKVVVSSDCGTRGVDAGGQQSQQNQCS